MKDKDKDIDEIDYYSDTFGDIVKRDKRYAARGYALLMEVINFLSRDGQASTDTDVLEEFRLFTLEQFGAMAYTVLDEWGIHSCRDVGNMVENLADFGRVRHTEGECTGAFDAGYDFKEAFLGPYDL